MAWVAGAAVLAAAAWGVVIYNRLVRDRNRVLSAWSDIAVQLKRRRDLIPKLVEAVKQYAAYEQATLATVTELRVEAAATPDFERLAFAEGRIGTGVRQLIALAERYPELEANRNFLDLQQEISEVEDQIQYARRYYNGAVRNLNTRIDTLPDALVARGFRFRPASYFDPGE
ncbi:MAG: LemA family protein [Proteobacteria bacterium]|nr:MAG: LemA family protein [Pseudomonadota bacterium]